MGVFHPDLVGIQVRVMQRLGANHVLTVYGVEGLDEISLSGETMIGELKDGDVHEYKVHPEDFGMPVYGSRVLKVANAQESREKVLAALGNEDGPVRDIVILNAGAALYAANVARSIKEGIERAREAVKTGAARAKLEEFVAKTQSFAA
jgi:anthranilate phosphoribosyltransferase